MAIDEEDHVKNPKEPIPGFSDLLCNLNNDFPEKNALDKHYEKKVNELSQIISK